jgi:transposase
MTRDYARSLKGVRVYDRVPRNRGTVTTMIGALSVDGVDALMTVEGATTGEVFNRFVREHLAAVLLPGDLVIMDNLGAHHATGIREAIEAVGAHVLYLPPYSPEFNPIELCWSKMKQTLKSWGARTVGALRDAIGDAAALVSTGDAIGWFTHCGYANQLG